jgi:uncharacterized protein (UPF0212 family)
MQGFSSGALLQIWEHGLNQHPVDRALAMLAPTLGAEDDASTLAELPIGERDARLLDVRARTFGPRVTATTQCPQCGERLETEFLTSDLSRPIAVPAADTRASARVRALTSRDLMAAASCPNLSAARDLLAARCVLGEAGDLDVAEIARLLEEADSEATRVLDLACPNCAHGWDCEFDIADFFWSEIEAAALRLLRDVHALARTYGWSEREILLMSPARRRAYLELVL